ncbi:PD-(D/E)XK nuclease family protein [Sulfurovum sp. XGS-02]|uniref:PD-(D/E)XK nuclease family protein n=1 Tax=Sulfurovum sp. XGS-02 TaxID=2925411 RepID=UPI0020450D30|nr:PD-(D/E)XK nuclease family protein [Sulfurovum sp. XGS-02]UPT76674.1 PD-(D/E)XK nuclease family protein [Sulfurovum sp. XGS-02]
MSQGMSQNIFDYATSELSQDAFISLLIGWFDNEEEELHELSKDFISELYTKYQINMIGNHNAKDLEIKSVKLRQQYHKIDVYFEVETDEETIPFIIEDKTWTEPHSDQLLRYTKKVSKDNAVKVFFKTGHITEKDRNETKKASYIILDTLWLYDFLKNYHNINNLILKDYIDYIERNFYNKLYKNNSKKELEDWEYTDAKEGYVQYAILEKIKHLTLGHNEPIPEYIRFTRNGKRWDTWWTCHLANDFSIFVKMKQLKEGHCLRLMEYSKKDFTLESKTDSLNKNIEITNNILKSIENSNIRVNKKPRYKARESEIAIMNLSDPNSLEDAVKEFSVFLKKFIDNSSKI